LAEVEAQLLSSVFLGVVAVNVETIMGGNSLELGIGVRVEKPGGLVVAGPTDGTTDCANMDTIMLRWGSKSS
ncbi:hypothetical protein Tco_1149270, partial [Tanacetum coccineum]